jgi:hypothetical protein
MTGVNEEQRTVNSETVNAVFLDKTFDPITVPLDDSRILCVEVG